MVESRWKVQRWAEAVAGYATTPRVLLEAVVGLVSGTARLLLRKTYEWALIKCDGIQTSYAFWQPARVLLYELHPEW